LKSYADTSFVVSLYVPDVHSPAAIAAMGKTGGPVLITALIEVELCNAIELRVFRKELTGQQGKAAAQAFEEDLQNGVFSLQPLPAATFGQAKRLARQHTASLGTRTLDLLHVAAALTLGADSIFSFDASERKLAHAAGLHVRPKTA
jgi:predicted nucleic acid-binding protein